MASISDQLRALITDRGLSAYQLGAAAAVPRSAITRFLAGEDLKLSTLDKLAAVLGLRLAEVATGRRRAARPKRALAQETGRAPDDGTRPGSACVEDSADPI